MTEASSVFFRRLGLKPRRLAFSGGGGYNEQGFRIRENTKGITILQGDAGLPACRAK